MVVVHRKFSEEEKIHSRGRSSNVVAYLMGQGRGTTGGGRLRSKACAIDPRVDGFEGWRRSRLRGIRNCVLREGLDAREGESLGKKSEERRWRMDGRGRRSKEGSSSIFDPRVSGSR